MKDEIIKRNLGLIKKVINDLHCRYNIIDEYDDLYQIGAIGLVRAAEKYDKTKTKESTFFYTCIRNQILQHFTLNTMKKRKEIAVSLYTDIGENRELIDVIPDSKDIEKELITLETRNAIRKALNKMKNKQYKKYLLEYYGIDRPSLNMYQIAQKYGVSYQYIQQSIKRGLEILRKELKNEKILFKD